MKVRVITMGTWNDIFRERGKFFITPHKDIKKIIKVMKKEKAKRVLDLGCGSGRHTRILARNKFKVYAADISEEGLKLTRKWLKEEKLKAKTKKMSCYERFPFKDNFFDAIISIQVIHHNYHDKIKYCISEIERVLKPGGILFVSVAESKHKTQAHKSKLGEPRTYIPLDGDEKGLPHFIYNKKLLRKDFRNFKILKIYQDSRKHYCLLGKLKISKK